MDTLSVKFMIAKLIMSAEIDEFEGLLLTNSKLTQAIVTLFRNRKVWFR